MAVLLAGAGPCFHQILGFSFFLCIFISAVSPEKTFGASLSAKVKSPRSRMKHGGICVCV